jgi:hypothetical protein
VNDCATQKMRFETRTALTLEAAFDGGRLTSQTEGFYGWQRRTRSWVCAMPSQNSCRSGERGKDSTL